MEHDMSLLTHSTIKSARYCFTVQSDNGDRVTIGDAGNSMRYTCVLSRCSLFRLRHEATRRHEATVFPLRRLWFGGETKLCGSARLFVWMDAQLTGHRHAEKLANGTRRVNTLDV